MQRDWESFFKDIFSRSPLIAVFLVLGLVVGAGLGLQITSGASRAERVVVPIFLRYLVVGTALAGGFVGLVVGVIADSIAGSLRVKDKKRRKKRPRVDV